ncbi:hypothetical protein SLS54_000015 [Diplodia seriata]
MVPDETLNNMFEASTAESQPVPLPFGQPGRALALAIRVPGMLDTFQFIDDEEHAQPLGDHEVEIAVKAVGMNFHDVMVSIGQIADTDVGVECSGIITHVGSDRTITFHLGCFRIFLQNQMDMFQKIPDGVSFEDAGSLPCIYSTLPCLFRC